MALPKGKSLSAMRLKMQSSQAVEENRDEELSEEDGALSGEAYGLKLEALLKDVDGSMELDDEAKEFVLRLADEFVERVTKKAALYAKHRNSATLDAVDLRLCLEKHWGITVPGLNNKQQTKPQPWTYRRPIFSPKKRKAPTQLVPPPVVVDDAPRILQARPISHPQMQQRQVSTQGGAPSYARQPQQQQQQQRSMPPSSS